jgi:hypothetical protein
MAHCIAFGTFETFETFGTFGTFVHILFSYYIIVHERAT